MKRHNLITLAILLPDGELPGEFRIFASGWNTTLKGKFLFDAEAARALMSAYQTHGIDVMLDLEHLSLDTDSPSFDPDARGWTRLELRNGELWAVGVKWNHDGERRLKEKRQRYISPAFDIDPKTRRITRLINIAITALPATDNLTPLVAASERTSMDPKLCEALGLPADATVEQVLAAIAALKAKQDEAMKQIGDAAKKDGEQTPATTTTRAGVGDDVADSLAKDVATLTARLNEVSVREILTANRGKTTPAFERWALKQAPEKVLEVLSVMPELPKDPAHREAKKKTAEAEVKLTAEERKVCRLTQTSEADFLAEKKKLAAKASELGDDDTEEN